MTSTGLEIVGQENLRREKHTSKRLRAAGQLFRTGGAPLSRYLLAYSGGMETNRRGGNRGEEKGRNVTGDAQKQNVLCSGRNIWTNGGLHELIGCPPLEDAVRRRARPIGSNQDLKKKQLVSKLI